MPKVYLTERARREAREKEAEQALRLAVATRRMKEQITQKEIAERMGMAPVTLSRRLSRPDMFTVRELRRLAEAIGASETELTRWV